MYENDRNWILNHTDNGVITSSCVTNQGIHRSTLGKMVRCGDLGENNIEKFDGEDFMFKLTSEELEILRCKNFTSSWGVSQKSTDNGTLLLCSNRAGSNESENGL